MGRSHAQRIRLRRSGARVRYTSTAAAISGSATSAYIALARQYGIAPRRDPALLDSAENAREKPLARGNLTAEYNAQSSTSKPPVRMRGANTSAPTPTASVIATSRSWAASASEIADAVTR